MPKTITTTVRLDPAIDARVEDYAIAKGMPKSSALRLLIETGLDTAGASLMTTPLAAVVTEVLEGRFAALKGDLEDGLEEYASTIEERVAKVASKGTRASMQSALMLTDIMIATYGGNGGMSSEDVYAAYQRQAGLLQRGAPYSQARSGDGEVA